MASGYVIYDVASGTFQLSLEHALLLGADDSPLGGAAQLIVSAYRSADKFVEAMRTGKGLGWSDHHPDLFEAVERLLGPVYRLDLAATWIPALEGITAGGRVADVGCGHGAASLVVSLAEDGAALGGQAGEARLRAIFREAGLRHFALVAEGELNFVYEARVR